MAAQTHAEEIVVDVKSGLLPEDVEVGAEGHGVFLKRQRNWIRKDTKSPPLLPFYNMALRGSHVLSIGTILYTGRAHFI